MPILRIKQLHPSSAATYHQWNGSDPIRDTPTGWGEIIGGTIITVSEAEFTLLDNYADACFIQNERDRRAVTDS